LIPKKNHKKFMPHQFIFMIIFVLNILILVNQSIAAEDKKKEDNAGAAHGGPPIPIYIPPLPRHVEFPSITYGNDVSVEGETELNISKKRFWYVFVLASWNPKSIEITEILNKNYNIFNSRNVGIIGLFSNDTKESVMEWRKKNNPLFLNEFASRNFLDALKNPKIPTVWVIGSQGEVLQRLDMPTKENMQESVRKVMILTGF